MTPLFPSVFEEDIFWIIFLAGMLVSSVIEDRGAKRSSRSRRRAADRGTYVIANLGLFVSLAIAILLGYARSAILPNWFLYPGLATYLLGIAFSIWAVSTLGQFYAPIVQVQSDHRVIDSGPYRLIRHPIYAGAFLSFFGLGLALQSWAAISVLLVAVGLGYANRMRVEEKFLVAELGDDYVEYCKRTKRIIPFIF
jgi:protein-S-isoprenylcysteine O-methyltransferase Ste14